MINPWWLELPMSRTYFYGPKDIRAIGVRLYQRKQSLKPQYNFSVVDRRDTSKLSPFASWPFVMINPQYHELLISRSNFHGPKDVWAIEVEWIPKYLFSWGIRRTSWGLKDEFGKRAISVRVIEVVLQTGQWISFLFSKHKTYLCNKGC